MARSSVEMNPQPELQPFGPDTIRYYFLSLVLPLLLPANGDS